ncbi:MAG: hypothetical protein ABR512_07060 [Desulfopila sp.]
MTPPQKNILILIGSVLLIIFLAVGFYLENEFGVLQRLINAVNTELSAPLFISLMLLLPILGFPISILLTVNGIKFGIFFAIVLWLIVLPIHTFIGYAASRYFRPVLIKLLSTTFNWSIPTVPQHHEAMFSFVFLAIPGIPYAGKNYLLPLAGVPLRYCVMMNCIVQGALGLPFIILGKSGASMDATLFFIALVVFILFYLLVRWLQKKYS